MPRTGGRYKVSPGVANSDSRFEPNRSQTWCSWERGVPAERDIPHPKEISLVLEVSETTLQARRRPKNSWPTRRLEFRKYWMVDVAARGSQDTPAVNQAKTYSEETPAPKTESPSKRFPDVTIPGGQSLLIAPRPSRAGSSIDFSRKSHFREMASRRHNPHYVTFFS